MSRLSELESFCRLLLLSSVAIWIISAFYKDKLPPPAFYDQQLLSAPIQEKTYRESFVIHTNEQTYRIKPLFNYHLNGVVVTYSNADGFGNIWHHRRWHDFINIRDLCVIWGDNVRSGVYRKMNFSSDSWTCWYGWKDHDTGKAFHSEQLSNNHLLVDTRWLKRRLLEAEPGDQIQFSGLLVEYENPAHGFKRGTSVVRNDSGNGACETVFLDSFTVIKKANPGWRFLYFWSKWISLISLLAVIVLLFIAPVRKSRH